MNTDRPSPQRLPGDLSNDHIKDNILSLRRRLKLSQGEFIGRYLSDEGGKPLISVPKLSNLEHRGGKDAERLAAIVAGKISMDLQVFRMNPDGFAKNIDLFIESELSSGVRDFSDIPPLVSKNSYVETLVHVISDYLTDRILAGDLRPGDKLPSDRTLSLMFNVGRTSIREALKVLSVLGLIDIRPGQGTFICRDSSNFFLMPLSWSFFMGEHNVDNIIDVRNVLEVESAKLAAKFAREENLDKLANSFNLMSEAYLKNNFQDFLDMDLDFHLAIAECSQNPIICNLLLTTRKLIRYISKSGMVSLEHLNNIYGEHTLIYNAIVARDSKTAMEQMYDHLEKSKLRYQINK